MTERVAHAARYANAIKIIPPKSRLPIECTGGAAFSVYLKNKII